MSNTTSTSETVSNFARAIKPFMGEDVVVTLVRPDKQQVSGHLLRFAVTPHTTGLVIAGEGIVPVWEIDVVSCNGRSVRFADYA